jgi:hypothetical protein
VVTAIRVPPGVLIETAIIGQQGRPGARVSPPDTSRWCGPRRSSRNDPNWLTIALPGERGQPTDRHHGCQPFGLP